VKKIQEETTMRIQISHLFAFTLTTLVFGVVGRVTQAGQTDLAGGKSDATIDLMTKKGVAQVKGEWRYSDTRILEVTHRKPGPDGQPTGESIQTYDYIPRAGRADYNDSQWEKIDPSTLSKRRSTGRLCFNWYRIGVTIPERIGSFDPTGSTVVFETTLDDYAEIWVDGELPRRIGQQGGSLIAGWNAPNRLVIGRGVKPGQKIQLAIFGANGPLSDPPANFIWMRGATLAFYRDIKTPESRAVEPHEVNVEIVKNDPALEALVPPNPKIYKLAEGFQFTEGPLWSGDSLLFSDPNANKIYRWTADGTLSVFRDRSGYEGADVAEYGQPGSNGITRDKEGRLIFCQHGNHAIVRQEKDGRLTVLADKFEGKRLNSPNDLVFGPDGALYFTDPPYGLPKFYDDPRRELDFCGVYRLQNGNLTLLTKDLGGPNGLAFSPNGKFFYVANWDERVRNRPNPAEKKKIVMRYEVAADGKLKNGKVFFDMGNAPEEEALDGLKVDQKGNLYVSGPGGIWLLSPEGKHLGTIRCPKLPANFAWGDADGKTLYLTARSGLYRIRLNIPGVRP
jgi:gluconolactonase